MNIKEPKLYSHMGPKAHTPNIKYYKEVLRIENLKNLARDGNSGKIEATSLAQPQAEKRVRPQ